MDVDRREFLRGTAWMGALALTAGGCASKAFAPEGAGAPMAGFAAPPLKRVRVGCVGLGGRGTGAVHRLAMIPGVTVAALCDFGEDKIRRSQKWLADARKPAAREFTGPEGWKKMCAWDGIDVVYNTTDWSHHAPIGLYAMECGKHVFIEVPSALTVEDCWRLVETSERTRRHCMQLENCCYGEYEMLCLALCRAGALGDLVYGECAYIHDLRPSCYKGYWRHWRLEWNKAHRGNQYPTHGFGPVCQWMNVNRGDRLDHLVSLESKQANFEAYAAATLPPGARYRDDRVAMGDMNVTLVRTELGRLIEIKHDVSTPQPYTRIVRVSGTKGMFWGMPARPVRQTEPYRIALEEKPGDGSAHAFLDPARAEALRRERMHPLWKRAGEIARKVGGHGGMDFLMDLRWAYCLQNGLPLDMSVYDLASWCSVCELSERSVRARGRSVDVPDFTRGAWKTTAPLDLVDVDLAKMGLTGESVKRDEAALNV